MHRQRIAHPLYPNRWIQKHSLVITLDGLVGLTKRFGMPIDAALAMKREMMSKSYTTRIHQLMRFQAHEPTALLPLEGL
ncbi:hypothetical protein M2401_002717 [Pseudomonas sp. JUb42]|jgi:hypothetical protein|uniref:DUF4113 domain-containing protein n=1 Tax=Pseudomonas sp. JUb42 TaxID=2940611 RepID=UPI00216941CB|nr:DUF4113 domain-containing protein [Pseudomonas sp. JUb42]MCS3468979.1 hypothetical protein [Pseudomonas sp. JUb42]